MKALYDIVEASLQKSLTRSLGTLMGSFLILAAMTFLWVGLSAWAVVALNTALASVNLAFAIVLSANICFLAIVYALRHKVSSIIIDKLDGNEKSQEASQNNFRNNEEIFEVNTENDKTAERIELAFKAFNLIGKVYDRYKYYESTDQDKASQYLENQIKNNIKVKNMELEKMKSTLQDLIIRLQDAEKGFLEIKKSIVNENLRDLMDIYANERHRFHRALEGHMKTLGEEADVKTSILGELHRLFIDIKVNNLTNDFESVVNEIERGASVLISDYENALNSLSFPKPIEETLVSQRNMVKKELDYLKKLKQTEIAVS